MRLRIRFSKLGKVRFTSHRDVARIWERTVRRAGVPVRYSEGFAPRPRLSFGLALSTGAESLAEYVDLELARELDGDDPIAVASTLDAALPDGFAVMAAEVAGPEAGSLQQVVTSCGWQIDLPGVDVPTARAAVDRLLAADAVVVKRERKGKPVEDDLRPAVLALSVLDGTAIDDTDASFGGELSASSRVEPYGMAMSRIVAEL
ncbi:MAG TPA: TIGR03936 family radical SAM-associated protein, partial [Acidimicrobiales bacterium]